MTESQKHALRKYRTDSAGELHHGDCVGADSEAHDIAVECGYGIVLHPPSNYSKRAWREALPHMMRREKAYLDRNRDIVNETVALIAAPAEMDEQPKGGTWFTIRYARRQGKTVVIIFPDGSISQRGLR